MIQPRPSLPRKQANLLNTLHGLPFTAFGLSLTNYKTGSGIPNWGSVFGMEIDGSPEPLVCGVGRSREGVQYVDIASVAPCPYESDC